MKNKLLLGIERMLNYYISLDPESQHSLKKMRGKVIQIELLNLTPPFELRLTGDKIELNLSETTTPDTFIKGTPLSLLRMTLARGENRKQFFSGDVSIQGNLDLGQEMIALFDQLDIDWEEWLAQKIGDIPAYHLGQFMRKAKKGYEKAHELLVSDLNDYLHEEKTWFPQREILQEFFDEVDELRMHVDRLEMKIKELM